MYEAVLTVKVSFKELDEVDKIKKKIHSLLHEEEAYPEVRIIGIFELPSEDEW